MTRLNTPGSQGDNVPAIVTGYMCPPPSAVLNVVEDGKFTKTVKTTIDIIASSGFC